jgi:hypothetical protein
LSVIRKKLSTFMRMDLFHRALMIEASIWLAIARLTFLIFPFPHVAKRLGNVAPPDKGAKGAAMEPERNSDSQLARDIGWAANRLEAHAWLDAAGTVSCRDR